MARLLVLGSAARDTIEIEGEKDIQRNKLGGSGVYASYAGAFFTQTALICAVGADWDPQHTEILRDHGIDVDGIETRQNENTLFWHALYLADMNERRTKTIRPNAMGTSYLPVVPDSFKKIPYVFLANGSPTADTVLLQSVSKPKLVVADTIGRYLAEEKKEFLALLKRINGLFLNDEEAALLTGEHNATSAARKVLELGPSFVVIKHGSFGATFMSKDDVIYRIPAFPVEKVVDPTGAGDTFGGAFMGALAQSDDVSSAALARALEYATVVASFTVEAFSLDGLRRVTTKDIEKRVEAFRVMRI
ncbi:MAG: sugar kinase [Thermoguttaceae bacterium]|nr:sugar kinase [Thermoguttaceae bacterium]